MTTDSTNAADRNDSIDADLVREMLTAGHAPGDVAAQLGLPYVDGAVVVSGWYADDGNADVEFPDAATAEAAAQEYVDGGEWSRERTWWCEVRVWRNALTVDDGEVVDVEVDEDRLSIAVEPSEPDECSGTWVSPHEVVGGDERNPGVRGSGGGVVITEVCPETGWYRVTDTWAQDSCGRQGKTSVEYREPDEVSLAWIQQQEQQEQGDEAE